MFEGPDVVLPDAVAVDPSTVGTVIPEKGSYISNTSESIIFKGYESLKKEDTFLNSFS